MPKVVIGGTVIQSPQISRIDLVQEAVAGIVECIRLKTTVRHVVQRMAPCVVDLPAQAFRKAADESGG